MILTRRRQDKRWLLRDQRRRMAVLKHGRDEDVCPCSQVAGLEDFQPWAIVGVPTRGQAVVLDGAWSENEANQLAARYESMLEGYDLVVVEEAKGS